MKFSSDDWSSRNNYLFILAVVSFSLSSCSSSDGQGSSSDTGEAVDIGEAASVDDSNPSDDGTEISDIDDRSPRRFRADYIEIDNGNDGTLDSIFSLRYNSTGLFVEEEVDRGADGSIDTRNTLNYVDDRFVRSDIDRGDDGTIDSHMILTYGEKNRLNSLSFDLDLDGVNDSIEIYIYSNGLVTSSTLDQGADGTIEEVATYTYDQQSRLVSVDIDTDQDAVTDIALAFPRDADGKVLRRERDVNNDGMIEDVWHFFYTEDLCAESNNLPPLSFECVVKNVSMP